MGKPEKSGANQAELDHENRDAQAIGAVVLIETDQARCEVCKISEHTYLVETDDPVSEEQAGRIRGKLPAWLWIEFNPLRFATERFAHCDPPTATYERSGLLVVPEMALECPDCGSEFRITNTVRQKIRSELGK